MRPWREACKSNRTRKVAAAAPSGEEGGAGDLAGTRGSLAQEPVDGGLGGPGAALAGCFGRRCSFFFFTFTLFFVWRHRPAASFDPSFAAVGMNMYTTHVDTSCCTLQYLSPQENKKNRNEMSGVRNFFCSKM